MSTMMMGRTVLVTGANGGLGTHFVDQALRRGATKVYAAARSMHEWRDARVAPLEVDVTSHQQIAAAVALASDVDFVVNNAGIAPKGDSISGPEAQLRSIFETNFFGALRVANAFAPTLGRNGGGTLVNVLSLASWLPVPTGYAASKAAMWSASNALRLQLRGQGTQVVSVLVGMVDTPMAARWNVPKVSAESVVNRTYDGVADGMIEILADDAASDVKSQLGVAAEQLYPALHEMIGEFEA